MTLSDREITAIKGGQTSNLFWRAINKLESALGIDLPTPDDFE